MNILNQRVKTTTISILILGVVFLLLLQYHNVLFQDTKITDLNRRALLKYDQKHDPLSTESSHPEWLPFIFSGMPFVPDILIIPKTDILDRAVLSFFNWFSFIIGEPLVYMLIINSILLSLFLFIFLKMQNLSTAAAIFPALLMPFLPLFSDLARNGLHSVFYTVALAPLLLVTFFKLSQKQNALYLSLNSVLIGLMFLRGQFILSTMILALLVFYYVLFYPKAQHGGFVFSSLLIVLAVLMGFLLSAVHYFPAFINTSSLSVFGEPVLRLENPFKGLSVIIPSFFKVLGQQSDPGFNRMVMYLGAIVLFLAGVAFFFGRQNQTRFWGVLGLSGFILFLIGFMVVPPVSAAFLNFAYLLVALSVFILTAYGLQQLKVIAEEENDRLRSLKKYAGLFFGLILLVLIYLVFAKMSYLNSIARQGVFLTIPQRIEHYTLLIFDVVRILFFLFIAFYCILLYMNHKLLFRNLVLILAILSVLDFGFINRRLLETGKQYNEDTYFNATPAVYFFKSDKSFYRILPVQSIKCENWYALHKIESVSGYSRRIPDRYQTFLQHSGYQHPFSGFLAKYWRMQMDNKKPVWMPVPLMEIPVTRLNFDYAMLDMLNVKYIVVDSLSLPDPRYELVYDTGRQRVYENTTVLPRVFFADTVKVIVGRRHVFDYMQNRLYDPREVAILEQDPGIAFFKADSNRAEIVSKTAHEIVIDADTKNNTIMVLSEPYYPHGWKAYIDGIETKIYAANSVLRSVILPAGTHRVVFTYKAGGYAFGKWTSLSILLFIVLLLVAVAMVHIKNKYQKEP